MTTETNPLRIKIYPTGVKRLQGVFTMRDQEGFPLDMSYELAKERGWEIDWVEALADAARQSMPKYDALVKEIRMLEPEKADSSSALFYCGLMCNEGNTPQEKAANLYNYIRRESESISIQ